METRHIVTYKPTKYMTQPFYRYCGIFQIMTILESRFWLQKWHKEFFTWFTKFTWFTLPNQLVKKFNELWLSASFLNKEHFTIESVKHYLNNDKNIVLLTGHGYKTKWDSFNPLKAFFGQHYISIWGYDNIKKGFYIYDSSIKQTKINRSLPIGNMFLPEYIMRKALARAWWWLMRDVIIVV